MILTIGTAVWLKIFFAPAHEHKYFSSLGMIEDTYKTTKYSLSFRRVHSPYI